LIRVSLVMVNLSMSRSTVLAPLFVTAALGFAGAGAPLGAQRAEVTVRRSVRAPASDSSGRELRRLERRIDSLVRTFETDDRSATDRFRIGRTIDALVAEYKAQRMRLAGANTGGMDGPYARRPEPALAPRSGMDVMFPTPMPPEAMARGWIGIVVSGAPREMHIEHNEMKMRFFSYPEIASVDPSSPAQRAGLSPGDTLLAYDGQDVRGTEISMTRLLRPNTKVVVRVRRDGRVRELPVLVAEAPSRIKLRRDEEIRDAEQSWVFAPVPDAAGVPALAPGVGMRAYALPAPPAPPAPATAPMTLPRVFESTPSGVAGAQLVTISDVMKRSLGLQSGVLVATVPVGTPADDSGLKEGDVIVRVDRQPVRTVVQVWQLVTRAAQGGERGVDLDLIRGKQARALRLRW
jgi:PDZ domain-containing protein